MKTLLIVDDETSNLDSLERTFARFVPPTPIPNRVAASCKSSPVATERCAGNLAQAACIDVVLTDLMMPGISGLDLLKAGRKLSPETEVILMTACWHHRNGGRGHERRCLRLHHQAAQTCPCASCRWKSARTTNAGAGKSLAATETGGSRASHHRWWSHGNASHARHHRPGRPIASNRASAG